MAIDNHSKIRQAKKLARKAPERPPHELVLIVTEGTKTEFHYFEAIRKELRIQQVHCHVTSSNHHTEPKQVVTHAQKLFKDKPEYDRVYAVFDRDDHKSFHEALQMTESKILKKSDKQQVRIVAVPSVPCFELWLLLHFQEQNGMIHRDKVYACLKEHLPQYEKNAEDTYASTKGRFEKAQKRAENLRNQTDTIDSMPWTNVDELVNYLKSLRP